MHYGYDAMSSEDTRNLPRDLIIVEAATSSRRFVSFAKDAIRNLAQRLIPSLRRKVVTEPDEFMWHAELGPRVSQVAAQYHPDVVILEYLWATPATEFLPPQTLKIVDTHDVLSNKTRIHNAGIDPFFYCSELAERHCLLRSDVIMAIQEEEASLFRKLVPERKVITARHAAEIAPSPSPGNEAVVLFVGSTYPANVHGITQFARECWPRVLNRRPEARLRIVGNVASKIEKSIPSCDRVGSVSDLSHEYQRAMIVINPVSFGTGLKIKSVEALCQGKVLVSTSNGVTGIPREDTEAFVVADDWDYMANRICQLMEEEPVRQKIAAAALELAHKHFDVEMVFRELRTVLEIGKSNLESASRGQ